MKHTLVLAVLVLVASATLAEEAKQDDDYVTTKEFKSSVFEVHNVDAVNIASALELLGSGFKGAGVSVNRELQTITVRDFPENIATMQEAIKRLDRPAAAEPEIDLTISVLIGSKSPVANAPPVPQDLVPVLEELKSTLLYANYALMATNVHHTRPGKMVNSSGVAEPTALGLTPQEGTPIFYNYRLDRIVLANTGQQPTLSVDNLTFEMRVPVDVGGGKGFQYQNVGFQTPVSVRNGEKVVIGTTTMGDKALIVVVAASIEKT